MPVRDSARDGDGVAFNDSINVDEQVLNIHADVRSGGVTGMASEDADGHRGNWSFTTIVTCADT